MMLFALRLGDPSVNENEHPWRALSVNTQSGFYEPGDVESLRICYGKLMSPA